jgi:hypothetical protein
MSRVPRPKSENDRQVTIKLPRAAVAQADELAGRMASPGVHVTRTDALRAAVLRGLAALVEEHPPEKRAKR